MSDGSSIEWTEATLNTVTGCTKVSPGCALCYIERTPPFRMQGRRFTGGSGPDGVGATTGVVLHPERVTLPLRWRKPRIIFVNSLADLFHDEVPDEHIVMLFAVAALTPRHTYQLLTKRPARMRALISSPKFIVAVAKAAAKLLAAEGSVPGYITLPLETWPLPNVWLGVSVEDQKRADLRIPALLDTTAAVRFLSCEPLLGPLNLRPWLADPAWVDGDVWPPSNARERSFDWVIVGGESGPGARPMHPGWARRIRDDILATHPPGHHALAAGADPVAFFFKQHGEYVEVPTADARSGDVWRLGDSVHLASPWRPDEPPQAGAEPGRWDEFGDVLMRRVGKKAAGRLLDGREHNDMPSRTTDASGRTVSA